MNQHRITMSDLVVGEPLPWDVYDAAGKLLLRKGNLVEHNRQIEVLVGRGLFIEAQGKNRKGEQAPKPLEIPSVLRTIILVNRRLAALLPNLLNEENAQEKLREVAQVLIKASTLDSDVALASILLNQETGIYPVRHCIDTAIVSLLVARSMKKSPEEVAMITAAALTMNVAMLRLQEKLQHSAVPLSDLELQAIRAHPQESAEQLRRIGITDQAWLDCVLMHHENEDGSGYPFGKSGAEIPLNAKIISIADRYCARVSERDYRKSLLPHAALRDILLTEKKIIDPVLTTAFVRELGIYPTGTFVRLQSGEIGVVTGKGGSSTTPYVHALIGSRGAPLAVAIKRDTSKQLYAIRDVLTEEQADVRFTMQQLWGPIASL